MSRIYWRLLAAGMILRILWVLVIPVEPVSDSAAYHSFATTIYQHGVYGWSADEPTAYWAVGTSAIAAGTYHLFGESFIGVVLLNLLTGLAIMMLTHALATRYFGARVGILALALVAFWPNLIIFSSVLSSELFFIALTLGGMYFWKRPQGTWWINLLCAGLIWGAACYIRPVILLAPLALALVDAPRGLRPFAASLLSAGVAMAMIVLIVTPWSLRNERVFGERVMVSTNLGPNMWMGNNPDSTGGYMPLPVETHTMTELERAHYLKDKAKAYMRDNPIATLKGLGVKLVQLNNRETIGVAWNAAAIERLGGSTALLIAKAVASGYWFVMLLGGIAGIVVFWRSGGVVAALFNPPAAIWGYFTAVHAVIVAEDRYHMPSSAVIAILAAVAFAALLPTSERTD